MRRGWIAGWFVGLGLAACGLGPTGSAKVGSGGDVGPADAGAHPEADAGPLTDAGPELDAGPAVDAGPEADAGSPEVDAGPAADPRPHLARDVAVDEVSLYQAVKVSLGSGGQAVARTDAPVVAGRGALVRVGVRPLAGFTARDVDCELLLGATVLRARVHATGASSDARADSFCAFQVPAAALTESTRWSARLLDADAPPADDGAASPARLPADGSQAPLGARTDAGGLQLVLVPIQWNGDGSGRLPDTSPAQLDRIRALLGALYPLTTLDLSVHAPLPYSGGYTWSGNVDFGDVNAELQQLRATDGAPAEAYYYGLVAPEATFDDYCGRSCVTGQSFVVDDPADADLRVGSGQGWGGEDAAWTLAHEVGHELGRYHAPCSAGGADPNFPYSGGSTGVWGYDARTGTFLDPADLSDFMGYCDPTWTSDYTWSAIFDRLLAVHGAAPRLMGRPARYRFLAVGEAGPRWRKPLTLRKAPAGPRVTATWLDAAGAALRTDSAARLQLAEGDEVEYALPEAPAGAASVRVDDAGGVRTYAVE